MKIRRAVTVGFVFAAVLIVVGSAAWSLDGGAYPQGASAREEGLERVLLGVSGMSCGSCEGRIRAALDKQTGVRTVGVDLAAATVTVVYEQGKTDPKTLADAITGIGYPARYLASGPGVALPGSSERPKSRGCGGNCCKSG